MSGDAMPDQERDYSVQEIAKLWHLSPRTVEVLFANEPGVLKFGSPTARYARKFGRDYYTLRIPESVAERVHKRLRVGL